MQSNEPEVNDALAKQHKLNAEEFARAKSIMGRTPTFTELGIFSAMWSEHCSYKSSRVWLAKLPTKAPWVIQGPGENAGVIDIGDGQAAVFKMESHNHPSFIEPFQGAATGVGGILRDVFTMGARPIANMNALRFGDPDHPKTRALLKGVVSGIGHYGNCVGVPTVGGETNFHKAYNGNILVNAMTVGLADTDKIFYSRGARVGDQVIYVGAKTGRDGVGGAVMSSDSFGDDVQDMRPQVQVGDPFTEKLLIEACLELMATDAITAIQDMGAAGLTSSSVEMADKGGVGIEIHMEKVPVREQNMTPYEMMLSESQERMLVILKPGAEKQAEAIFKKWDLDFAVMGEITDTGNLVVKMNGEVYADMPVRPLVDDAPKYHRPTEPTPKQPMLNAADYPLKKSALQTLKDLIGTPDLCSRRWIFEQYDCLVRGQTANGPGIDHNGGSDAAIVKIPGGNKALAITTDCTPRYCFADPHEGGKQVVAEAWRNITASGALPRAITDNMNFANPEKPRIMGQFADCVMGMAEACRKLDFPVISGNVSLYNETNGEGILPTPAIGGVGVMADVSKRMTLALKAENEAIILVGGMPSHIGQTIYLREVHGKEEGAPPPVDLAVERKNGDAVRELILNSKITACHDIAEGGLLVTIAEMAMSKNIGAELNITADAATCFGEDQARYVITCPAANADKVISTLKSAGVEAQQIGETIAAADIKLGGETIALKDLREVYESWMPNYVNG
ncbi:MAG TPA: phosphoribosylformylglycinamidine synthase subunit PurL [Alphaproteobacteria bacterium]|nr:phosphoribosylformylglycinamidine synthase subunit PurL [Alphaproteobacteria bacterium]